MTLTDLAAAVAGELDTSRGGNAAHIIVRVVDPRDAAGPDDLAFAADPRFAALLAQSKATFAVVANDTDVPANITAFIRVPWAKRALVETTKAFATPPVIEPGTHPTAVVHTTAKLGKNVNVGAFSYIGQNTVIGDNTTIQPQVYIGHNVRIGDGGFINPGARIMDGTHIGKRCIIHPNAVIGSDGFSFVTAEKGSVESYKENKTLNATTSDILRIASLGPVVVGDDVEIGSGTTIDRATLRTTRIGDGTKIDNQVQIGHNAQIGNSVRICGQAGVAGSATIGDRVVLAASSGIADNIIIGEDAIVGAAAGVAGNVPARTMVLGTPAMPRERFQALVLAQGRLPRLLQQIEDLKNKVKTLEDGVKTA
ncbi:MAG: UDP-3-O-(3-hydroxymyristoyl)glucosamine N-acyltransferase [Bdellovibrionales bacterium]